MSSILLLLPAHSFLKGPYYHKSTNLHQRSVTHKKTFADRQRAEEAEARESQALEKIAEFEALQRKWHVERAALIGTSVELEKQVSFTSVVGLF